MKQLTVREFKNNSIQLSYTVMEYFKKLLCVKQSDGHVDYSIKKRRGKYRVGRIMVKEFTTLKRIYKMEKPSM